MFAFPRHACPALFAVALTATVTAQGDSEVVFVPVYQHQSQSITARNTCWADAPVNAEVLCVSGPEHLALEATLSLENTSTSDVTVRLRSSDISAQAGADYAAIDEELSFAAGTTGMQVDIPLINDLMDENRETFTIELLDKSDEERLPLDYIHVTIIDEDGITMTVRDATANESEEAIQHFIDLSESVTWPITFHAKALDGTATAPEDYAPLDRRVTHVHDLEPDMVLIGVYRMHPIVDDAIDEPAETYTLRITGLAGVRRATRRGAMTIIDNDPTSTNILLTAEPPRVSEGDGATEVRVTATLDASARTQDTPVTVSVSGSGNAAAVDFVEVGDFTVTIAAGDTSGTETFTLTPVDDELDESDETVTVGGSADLAVTADTIALVDDDEGSSTVILSASPDRIPEGGGARTIGVTAALDGSARTVDTAVSVSVTDSGHRDAVDYAASRTSFDITIAAGATAGTGTFTVTPEDDDIDERDEVLNVGGASDLSVTPTSVTLTDDDQASTEIVLSAAPSTVAEGAGTTSVEVTATLDAGGRAESTTVSVTVSGSGNPDAVDFTAVPDFAITIAARATSGRGSFNLTPDDDDVEEVSETLTVSGSATLPVSGTSVKITDNDVASDGIALSASPAVVSEGDGAVPVRVTASLNGAARQAQTLVTVSVSGSGDPQAVDFRPVADFTIAIASGAASGAGTFTLEPMDDATVETDETLTLSGASDLAVESTTVRLADDDDASMRILLSAVPDRVAEGDGPTPVTVTATLDRALRQRATSIAVTVTGGGDPDAVDFAAIPDFTITIPANAASGDGRFTLEPLDDTSVETDEELTISGMSDLSVTPATVTLADDDEVSTRILLFLAVDPPRASEGDGEIRVTVTAAVDRGVRPDDTRVAVSVSGSGNPDAVDFAAVPDFGIVIPANAPSGTGTFAVVPEDDLIPEADETLTVSGVSDLPVTPATMELLDNDETVSRELSIADAEGPEGAGVLEFAVTLVGPSASGVTVDYATVDPTGTTGPVAGAGVDYERQSGTLTLAPGEVKRTVRVRVLDDGLDEADERFAVELSDLRGARLGRGVALGVIEDDDAPPALSVADASGNEDVRTLEFAVTLSAPSGRGVSASYATSDGTAAAGIDYVAASGTVVFAPGEVSKGVRVEVLDDAAHEAEEETFELSLAGLVNASAGDVSATGTIRDDDLAPPSLAGGLPAALLCVGGAPHEVELADYFSGEELRFAAVSSVPGAATVSLAGSRLTIEPVAEGESSVSVEAWNDAGLVSGSMSVRVVTDPAELAAVESALASIGRAVLTGVTGSVRARFDTASAAGPRGGEEPGASTKAWWDPDQSIGDAGAGIRNQGFGPAVRGGGPAGWDERRFFGPEVGAEGWLDAMNRAHGRGMAPFSFALESAQPGSAGPAWSVWGRGDLHRFESGTDGSSHDGSLTSVHLGADARLGEWLAGVSVARSAAEADYRFERSVDACGGGGVGEGMMEADLTSAHPYAGRRIGEGWVWGTVGAGSGEVVVERCETGELREADLSMRLGALGGRHPFAYRDGMALSVVEEIGVVDLATGDADGPIGDRSVTVGQARLGLEASGVVPAGCECSLSSFVRIFARGDWGDGATGAGVELAAGARFRNLPRRIGVDAEVRALTVHSAEDAEDRSANVTFSILPRADGTGWRASLAWRLGTIGSPIDMANDVMPWAAPSSRFPGAQRHWIAESRLGYGIVSRRGIATPFLEFDAGPTDRGGARFGMRHQFGDRTRGLTVEWGIEQNRLGGAADRILLEAAGRF